MRKLKIYLDTSAIGYLDEQESPKEMAEMKALWQDIKMGKYEVYLSQITLEEIYANQNKDKVKVLTNYLSEIEYAIIEIKMTFLEELREIRAVDGEKIKNMTTEEMREYFAGPANELQKMIDEKKAKRASA